jgi:hypothetical protein
MNILTKNGLKSLMRMRRGPCVSIFMPMQRVGPDTQQHSIEFKNLLREAEEHLSAYGLRAPEARQMLEPAASLLRDGPFREHRGDGLALFLSPEMFHCYVLPLVFKESVIVANRFHIRPLVPFFSGDGRFYVLALSQNKVRLLQGSHYSVNEVDLSGVPENLAQTLRDDDSWKDLYMHSGGSGGGGQYSAVAHGHQVDTKKNLLRYFRQIDNGLHDLLREERAPLLLAGVDYLHSMYTEVNTYPHLMKAGVSGNPEHLSSEKLHEQAWAVVIPHFQKGKQEAMDRYKDLAGTNRASNSIGEIVPASHGGKIELLFISPDFQQWGTFDPDTSEIHMHKKEKPNDEDLFELVTIQTLLNKGTVYVVEPEHMPDAGSVAAVFRY